MSIHGNDLDFSMDNYVDFDFDFGLANFEQLPGRIAASQAAVSNHDTPVAYAAPSAQAPAMGTLAPFLAAAAPNFAMEQPEEAHWFPFANEVQPHQLPAGLHQLYQHPGDRYQGQPHPPFATVNLAALELQPHWLPAPAPAPAPVPAPVPAPEAQAHQFPAAIAPPARARAGNRKGATPGHSPALRQHRRYCKKEVGCLPTCALLIFDSKLHEHYRTKMVRFRDRNTGKMRSVAKLWEHQV